MANRPMIPGGRGTIREPKLNSNRLPIQVAVIVPSTKVDKPISDVAFQKRIASERKFFSETFGGDTSVSAAGGYIGEEGKLITEKIATVESSMSKKSYDENRSKMAKHITDRQKEWDQETIGYAIEGNFYTYPKKDYIDHDKKNKNIKIV